MAEIGRSDLLIVPKFESKLSDTINKELGVASKSASNTGRTIGSQTAQGFSGGFAKAGVVAGAVSSVVNRAMSSIQDHVGAAVSRFDTLNLYPKTMQSIGFATKDAASSINYMSDRLQTLPTQLDTMAQTVKGLAVITNDLDKATKLGLGLNDMLIASGANQQMAGAAMEQFRQILAKGKPEMQDWKSLMQAMPGQMTRLAHALLGPTAKANDLYEALGGGKHEPILSMEQLIDAVIRLDQEGGAGITSFKEQAETAAGGIETQMANMNNAITRGLAGTLEAIGSMNIASFFGDVRGGILAGFKTFNGFIKDAVPTVKAAIPVFQALAPAVIGGVAAFSLFGKVESILKATSTFNMLAKAASQFAYGGVFNVIKGGFTSLVSSINPVTVGIVAIGAVVGVAASQFMKMKEHSDGVANGLKSINEVANQSHGLSIYSSMIDKITDTAGGAAMSVDALMKSISDSNSKIANTLSEATTSVGTLERARTIISNYAGATDLSTQAQGQLTWALSTLNEQLGLNISSTDVMNNSYTDTNGNVQKLTDSINELVSAKEKEIKTAALTETLTEQYKQRAAAAQSLAEAERRLNAEYSDAAREDFINKQVGTSDGEGGTVTQEQAEQDWQRRKNASQLGQDARDARKAYEELDAAVKQTEGDLEVNSKAVDANSDAYNGLVSRLSDLTQAYVKQHGSLADFSGDLQSLGADTTQLGDLTDEQWQRIAQAYDGTAASLVQPLRDLGVTLDDTAVKAQEATKQISDALNSFGANDAIESAGININDLSAAMANAGITAQDLQAIGSENFKALAINSNGNIQSIIATVQSLNAQGVNDKSFSITAHDNASGVLSRVKAELNSLHDKNIFVNLMKQNAAGGIRANAAGGLRMHADGAIVNRATPLDIVGEDGAEAIIPLTNKRYVKPFADAVAEGILGQSTNDALIRWLAQNLGAIIAASAPTVVVSEREQRRQIREMMA
ncbi:tape measure protein [Lancefieldella parvula]|uniref:tape measure protein n=1 Tax=Lancefieldella parvula TaxID=1382 RepID=UPI00288A1D01|nr:tape measure protein [Lancefieldella parvula]